MIFNCSLGRYWCLECLTLVLGDHVCCILLYPSTQVDLGDSHDELTDQENKLRQFTSDDDGSCNVKLHINKLDISSNVMCLFAFTYIDEYVQPTTICRSRQMTQPIFWFCWIMTMPEVMSLQHFLHCKKNLTSAATYIHVKTTIHQLPIWMIFEAMISDLSFSPVMRFNFVFSFQEDVLPNDTEKLLSGSTGDEGYFSLINLNLCSLINHGGKIQTASLQVH